MSCQFISLSSRSVPIFACQKGQCSKNERSAFPFVFRWSQCHRPHYLQFLPHGLLFDQLLLLRCLAHQIHGMAACLQILQQSEFILTFYFCRSLCSSGFVSITIHPVFFSPSRLFFFFYSIKLSFSAFVFLISFFRSVYIRWDTRSYSRYSWSRNELKKTPGFDNLCH